MYIYIDFYPPLFRSSLWTTFNETRKKSMDGEGVGEEEIWNFSSQKLRFVNSLQDEFQFFFLQWFQKCEPRADIIKVMSWYLLFAILGTPVKKNCSHSYPKIWRIFMPEFVKCKFSLFFGVSDECGEEGGRGRGGWWHFNAITHG